MVYFKTAVGKKWAHSLVTTKLEKTEDNLSLSAKQLFRFKTILISKENRFYYKIISLVTVLKECPK
jgi:hypothetical protein